MLPFLSPTTPPVRVAVLALAFGIPGLASIALAAGTPAAAPVPTVETEALASTRKMVEQQSPAIQAALAALVRQADEALKVAPVSVMEKDITGASGDKHDYLSMARYWWPDPSKPDGLPYIRKDGEVNREAIEKGDTLRLNSVVANANTLALAYALTGKPEYAVHAAKLLRVWFLDPATRMNPNFDGAQAVLGKNQGRGIGLIEFRNMYELTDALALLESSPAWTEEDRKGKRAWMEAYAEWLKTNAEAQKERSAKNNHGTWFDVQEMAVLLYLGRNEEARQLAEDFKTRRIAPQIEPDGRQPDELKRTTALHYTLFNLEGMNIMARLSRRVGVDLWKFETEDGRGMRKALDFALPYAIGGEKWPYQQMNEVAPERAQILLFEAVKVFGEEKYGGWLDKTPRETLVQSREWLLSPSRPATEK